MILLSPRGRAVLCALLALLATLLFAPAVLAHATLEQSDPVEGATISTPYVLVAQFDEELTPDGSSITVRNASGEIVAEGGLGDDAFHMVVDLPSLPLGTYAAHWIAITADDSGETQGDINFTVATATPSPVPTPSPSPPAAPTSTPTPSVSAPPTPSLAPSVAPTPPPGPAGSASGSELLLPIVLAVAVIAALGWFLLRRRPT